MNRIVRSWTARFACKTCLEINSRIEHKKGRILKLLVHFQTIEMKILIFNGGWAVLDICTLLIHWFINSLIDWLKKLSECI